MSSLTSIMKIHKILRLAWLCQVERHVEFFLRSNPEAQTSEFCSNSFPGYFCWKCTYYPIKNQNAYQNACTAFSFILHYISSQLHYSQPFVSYILLATKYKTTLYIIKSIIICPVWWLPFNHHLLHDNAQWKPPIYSYN